MPILKGMVINETILTATLVSLISACFTLTAVIMLMRHQRRSLQKTIADFAAQNVTMARRLTEIMLGQQKKQEAHEEALEKMAGYAMKMRKEINILAIRSADDDDDYATPAENTGTKRLH